MNCNPHRLKMEKRDRTDYRHPRGTQFHNKKTQLTITIALISVPQRRWGSPSIKKEYQG